MQCAKYKSIDLIGSMSRVIKLLIAIKIVLLNSIPLVMVSAKLAVLSIQQVPIGTIWVIVLAKLFGFF